MWLILHTFRTDVYSPYESNTSFPNESRGPATSWLVLLQVPRKGDVSSFSADWRSFRCGRSRPKTLVTTAPSLLVEALSSPVIWNPYFMACSFTLADSLTCSGYQWFRRCTEFLEAQWEHSFWHDLWTAGHPLCRQYHSLALKMFSISHKALKCWFIMTYYW